MILRYFLYPYRFSCVLFVSCVFVWLIDTVYGFLLMLFDVGESSRLISGDALMVSCLGLNGIESLIRKY